MVLGPEFGAIAALGVALVRRRFALLALAARTLILGFTVAIAITAVLALLGRALGWITLGDVTGPRPATAFIYAPDSGPSSSPSSRRRLSPVAHFEEGRRTDRRLHIGHQPAAGNIALGMALGVASEIWGSARCSCS